MQIDKLHLLALGTVTHFVFILNNFYAVHFQNIKLNLRHKSFIKNNFLNGLLLHIKFPIFKMK